MNVVQELCFLFGSMAILFFPKPAEAQLGVPDHRILCGPLEIHSGNPIEEPCLNGLREVAKRDGDTLILKLGNSKSKTIKNTDCGASQPEASCVKRELVGYIENRYFVVRVAPYECGHVLLINRRTGEETKLEGFPYLSPNRNRFVVTSASGGECDPAYGVAIFSLANDPPALEWQSGALPDDTDYTIDAWDGDSRVKLQQDVLPKKPGADLRLTTQGWRLSPSSGSEH